jgi:hypothetical protein
MAELAADGGCLTVDMGDSDEIARGLRRMVFDNTLRHTLAEQAVQRRIPDWDDYAGEVASHIRSI